MAISVDWPGKIIYVPQSYLTNLVPYVYALDVNQFRLDLSALGADSDGLPWPTTHKHTTETTISGVTYSRFVEIINGYKVEFEDGQYSVRLDGANNNIFDVENGITVRNQVSLISTNSAGLQTVNISGAGASAADVWSYPTRTLTDYKDSDIAVAVWSALTALNKDSDSFGELMQGVLTVKKFLALND